MSMKMCRGSHWQQTSVHVDDSNGFYFISSARWVSSAGLLWELCPEVNINDTVTSQKLNQMFENESLLFMFIRSTERWITAAVCWNWSWWRNRKESRWNWFLSSFTVTCSQIFLPNAQLIISHCLMFCVWKTSRHLKCIALADYSYSWFPALEILEISCECSWYFSSNIINLHIVEKKKKDLHVCMLRFLHSSLTSCKYFLFSVSSHLNLLEHCKWHFLSYVNKIVKYHTWCSANCSEQFLKSTFDTWSSDEPVVGGKESGTSFKYTAGATTAVFHDSGNLPGSREELITGVKWTSWRD